MKSAIRFRPLQNDDLDLLETWLNTPAIKEWWTDPSSPEAIKEKYEPRINGSSTINCFVILADNTPIGMVQSYLVDKHEEYASAVNLPNSVGMDWFIGDDSYRGIGLGPTIAKAFAQTISERYPEADYVVASPSINNAKSIHVLEKAGFKKGQVLNLPSEKDPEQLLVLQLD